MEQAPKDCDIAMNFFTDIVKYVIGGRVFKIPEGKLKSLEAQG